MSSIRDTPYFVIITLAINIIIMNALLYVVFCS